MAVLTSKGGVWARDPLREREDSRIRNYIGREGVLKSSMWPLVLVFE